MRTDSFNWFYKGEVFNPVDVKSLYGFIYILTYRSKDNGKEYSYIGKKSFNSTATLQALKSGTKRKYHNKFFGKNIKGKRVIFEELIKESKWREYEGSCKVLPKNVEIVYKDILKLCETKLDLTYWEDYYLMVNEVLFDKDNLNMQIAGRYFAEKITNSKPYLK